MKTKIYGRGDLDIPVELDSTVNFKVNSVLKQQFDELCKSKHSNVSRELKIFMTKAVQAQELDTKKWFFI